MIVVSNTSPITNLTTIGKFYLLEQLYGNVIIAQAVYDEIVVKGSGKPGAAEVQAATWIQPETVKDRNQVTQLELELDRGEAETIILGLERSADLLLLDERRGRRTATRLGLNRTGILGVLIEAKNRNFISTIKPLLDELRDKAGFWLSDGLYNQTLHASGETFQF